MEAIPKLALVCLHLKTSPENPQFGPKLKQYIIEAYKEDPESYNNEIHQLEGLRSAAVRPTIDEAGLKALIRYFCQLRSLQSRFPMSKGQPCAIPFTWKDLCANMSCTMADVRFEMACILYNIGALYSQLVAKEKRTTSDGLKVVCTNYQIAAWCFQHLRESWPQPPGVDLSADTMKFFQELCFGQAQECILEKSIQDNKKPSVVASVAMQVLVFYKNCLHYLGPSSGHDNLHEIMGSKLYNSFQKYLSFKVSYIGCIVNLYQGMNAEEQRKMGERVAYYQVAIEKLSEARKIAKHIEPLDLTQEALTFMNDVAEAKRKAAKNENEFIYHEAVPEKDMLSDPKPVCLVKAIPINFNDHEHTGADIFARLVPMGAHEASSMYSEEKAKVLRNIVTQIDAKNDELSQFMSSLQLDQLNILSDQQTIPQEVVDRCAAMNAKPEIIQQLSESMNNLAEIISDVEHALSEVKELILDETNKEKEYQKVIGPRPPSIVQTELSREAKKYQEAHNRTNESNQVLHKAMTLHIANLKLLAQPLEELEKSIPSLKNIDSLDHDTMTEMKRVVDKVHEMQKQRDTLIGQLREAINADDITPVLLARSGEPLADIFKEEIEKHTPQVKIIEQNLAAQENIINKLTNVYASYGDSRRLLTDVLRRREAMINALITSYDSHEDLLAKSQKGMEFYKKLLHNVSHLLTRVKSACQVQEEERTQLLSKQTGKAIGAGSASKNADQPVAIADTVNTGPKLRDYLPYMKHRAAGRNFNPAPIPVASDYASNEAIYPDSVYPTSMRPAPVGSEANTDSAPLPYTDGYSVPDHTSDSYSRQYPLSDNTYATQVYHQYNSRVSHESVPIDSKECDVSSEGTRSYPASETSSMTNYYNAYGGMQDFSNEALNQYKYDSQQNSSRLPSAYQGQFQTFQESPYPKPEVAANIYSTTDLSSNFVRMQVGHNDNSGNVGFNQPMYNAPYSQMPMYHSDSPSSLPPQITDPLQYPQTPSPAYYNQQLSVTQDSNVVDYPSTSEVVPHYNSELSISQQYMGVNNPNIEPSNSMFAPTSIPYSQGTEAIYSHTLATAYHDTNAAGVSGFQTQPLSNINDFSTNPLQNHQTSNVNYPNEFGQQITITGQPALMPDVTNLSGAVLETPNLSIASSMQASHIMNKPITPVDITSQASGPLSNSSIIANPLGMMAEQMALPIPDFDLLDKPIKSHVTGEALSSDAPRISQVYMPYTSLPDIVAHSSTLESMPSGQSLPPAVANTPEQLNFNYGQDLVTNYTQVYQNHPGYTFNATSGTYEYSYGSQNSQNFQQIDEQKQNFKQNLYTTAGSCEVIQTPSESQAQPSLESISETYYNSPYGYKTNSTVEQFINQVSAVDSPQTNYGADSNRSTYMHCNQDSNTLTTTSMQEHPRVAATPDVEKIAVIQDTSNNANSTNDQVKPEVANINQEPIATTEPPVAEKSEPDASQQVSAFDLLSGIDFTVELPTLKPEIKVPQVSENAIKKPTVVATAEPIIPKKVEEVIERPAKRDIFSDPVLLNKFTQEVKQLQNLVDSLTEKLPNGLTVLDSKWKVLQDIQAKEHMHRSKRTASKHSNVVTDFVPYDDSRLTVKYNPDAFLNASYYRQLAPWSIPLIISSLPTNNELTLFWNAILENKVGCVVCLLSEMEIQGNSYWPTAKGQSLDFDNVKVTLEESNCTVHWTERKLTVSNGKTVQNLVHFQINVFPAKVVCSPLVQLADRVLDLCYARRLSNQLGCAWLHCGAGAGRSALLALLTALMAQVRAGQINLCEMLESSCSNLYKHRTNVLEDTKYLADAFRTSLFYVQGVLCSGTTAFSGEAVATQSGAAMSLPSIAPAQTSQPKDKPVPKFSKESFEEMKQSGLKSVDMKDPLNFLDPLWSLKKK